MSPIRARTRLPVAFVVSLLALAGCGDGRPDPASGAEAGAGVAALTAGGSSGSDEDRAPPPGLQVPAADWGAADAEREPNDADSLAQRLGPQLAVRGVLDGRETDAYVWTVDGEPRYWYLEAVVPDRETVVYGTPDGREEVALTRVGEGPDGASVLALAGLYLLPGEHRLRVAGGRDGGAAPYRLRAVPVGSADPRLEREPNDHPERAHLLSAGVARFGYLPGPDDRDLYRYRARQPERLRVEVTSPPGQRLELGVELADGGRRHLIAADTGADLAYEALVPPGELSLELRAGAAAGSDPYRVRVVRLDPFDRPADLEPNDDAAHARPLPPTLVAEGDASGRDPDWYTLPPTRQGTRVTVLPSMEDRGRAREALAIYRGEGPGRTRRLPWEREDSLLAVVLPDSAPAFLLVNADGPYRVEVRLDPHAGPILPSPAPPRTTMAFAGPARGVAAFWDRAQRVELPVRIASTGTEAQTLDLKVHLSDPRWDGTITPTRVVVAAGETVTATAEVLIPPFAASGEPVQVSAAAFGVGGAHTAAGAQVTGVCGAPAVGEEEWWPLPESLLGGLNVAATALGAGSPDVDGSRWSEGDELLHDQMTPVGSAWWTPNAQLPAEHTVRLAGPGPSEVAGVVLRPVVDRRRARPRRFELLLSRDGTSWDTVLQAELRDTPGGQPFALERVVTAEYARLRILDAHGIRPDEEGVVQLAEFEVIARPGSHALERDGIDLADPRLGGHVVLSRPFVRSGTRTLLGEGRRPLFRPDPAEPVAVVLGFQHDRAARIRRIEWVQSEHDRAEPFSRLRVAASTDGPLGPWQLVRDVALDTARGGSTAIELDAPVWARFLRFSPAEERGAAGAGGELPYRGFPARLRVLEAPSDGRYRSIVGAWGLYEQSAIYERLGARRSVSFPDGNGNDGAERARELASGVPVAGTAQAGAWEAWHRVTVPEGDNWLELRVEQDPTVTVDVTVLEASGDIVTLERMPAPGRSATYSATVKEGRDYLVRVRQPRRYITVAWDQSGSVERFREALDRALSRFVEQVNPGVERLNLLPFRDQPDGQFVMKEWTEQPVLLQAGLAWRGEGDGSSEAERNLLAATRAMGTLPGMRAVLLMTDAESGDQSAVPALWESFERDRPRVFTVELQSGKPELQDVMQDWAAARGGHYDFFSTPDGLDEAFERTSCLLRRPALFTLSASTRYAVPPGPGRIRVRVDSARSAMGAIELVLDASGSMLQRLDGSRRIDIAKGVLEQLVTAELPAGTPLALRIFGHREAGSCRTDLEVPLAPLDAGAVRKRIRAVEAMNLARTPIGASLEKVRDDLQGADGGRFVVLITDGEETCDGDPAAAIDSLKAWGVDPRVSVIGFAVEDEALKAEFQRWARAGGGQYFDARGADELGDAIRSALRPKYQVLDESGQVVVEGVAGDAGVEIPAGRYSVRLLISPVAVSGTIEVQGDQQIELTLPE